jgi:hypothetical protein
MDERALRPCWGNRVVCKLSQRAQRCGQACQSRCLEQYLRGLPYDRDLGECAFRSCERHRRLRQLPQRRHGHRAVANAPADDNIVRQLSQHDELDDRPFRSQRGDRDLCELSQRHARARQTVKPYRLQQYV